MKPEDPFLRLCFPFILNVSGYRTCFTPICQIKSLMILERVWSTDSYLCVPVCFPNLHPLYCPSFFSFPSTRRCLFSFLKIFPLAHFTLHHFFSIYPLLAADLCVFSSRHILCPRTSMSPLHSLLQED